MPKSKEKHCITTAAEFRKNIKPPAWWNVAEQLRFTPEKAGAESGTKVRSENWFLDSILPLGSIAIFPIIVTAFMSSEDWMARIFLPLIALILYLVVQGKSVEVDAPPWFHVLIAVGSMLACAWIFNAPGGFGVWAYSVVGASLVIQALSTYVMRLVAIWDSGENRRDRLLALSDTELEAALFHEQVEAEKLRACGNESCLSRFIGEVEKCCASVNSRRQDVINTYGGEEALEGPGIEAVKACDVRIGRLVAVSERLRQKRLELKQSFSEMSRRIGSEYARNIAVSRAFKECGRAGAVISSESQVVEEAMSQARLDSAIEQASRSIVDAIAEVETGDFERDLRLVEKAATEASDIIALREEADKTVARLRVDLDLGGEDEVSDNESRVATV